MATVIDLREELRALNEQLSATQQEVALMADGREVAVAIFEQMQFLIAGYQQPGFHADQILLPVRLSDEKEFIAAWRILGFRKVWMTIG